MAQASFVTGLISLDENAGNSLFQAGGTSLMIHAKPDDYLTDPAGASGDRIACGIIVKGGPP